MSTYRHLCVWIDHQEAKVFGIGLDGADEMIVRESGPHRRIHRKADHVHQGKNPPDEIFLGDVAEAIKDATAILIAGPGTAKDEFAHFLKKHRAPMASRVWGVEPMDHPTDPEIISAARQFFRAADRMHV